MQTSTASQIAHIQASSLTSSSFFEDYQKQGIPVVIAGLLDTEPDWNLEYLCQQLGNQTFAVRCYGSDRYQQDKRQWTEIGSGVQLKKLTFNDYAGLLRSRVAHEQDMYLAKCPIQDTPLSHSKTFDWVRSQLGLRWPATHLNLWVGPAGHVECLHYDPTDGILMQLHGQKKIVLFPPAQLSNLYPFPLSVHLWHGLKLRSWFSQVYPDKPDFEAFPNFRQALQHKQEIILKAGELLFIPTGWWHEVTALGEEMTCSVNQFWHVRPLQRALQSWSKWRAHLGGVVAIPHSLISVIMAANQHQAGTTLRHRL
jgi:lysine-specific demethylase 8/hypoxia-inducible factor 1-alpha inhibitor (HIF hydroxylase)